MRLSIQGLAVAGAVVWGGLILLLGLANLIWPAYGLAFLELVASIYPGYQLDSGAGGVLIGTLYGLLYGSIGGALIAWIYNLAARQT